MNKTKNQRKSYCPVAYTLDIIGDRWAILIIRDILFRDKFSFGDFLNAEEGIATNILTSRLKRLEELGIISKTKDKENLTKFIYRLTDKGLDLLPIMIEMIAFAEKYDTDTAAPKNLLNKIKNNRDEFIENFRKKHKAFKSL